jgi:hypothetical protein
VWAYWEDFTLSTDDESVDALLDVVASSTSPTPAIDETLSLLTHAACQNLPAVDYASMSIRYPDGRLETVGATDEVPVQSDKLQYLYREGPCYEAVTEGHPLISGDIATDPRWPRYGPEAAQFGVGAQFALQVYDNKDSRGALNLYARAKNAFDGEHDLVRLFGVYAATVLGYAREVDQLKRALATRGEIGRAVGIVMERYGLSADRAFDFLIRISQTGNVKLHVVAREVVAAADRPRPSA